MPSLPDPVEPDPTPAEQFFRHTRERAVKAIAGDDQVNARSITLAAVGVMAASRAPGKLGPIGAAAVMLLALDIYRRRR